MTHQFHSGEHPDRSLLERFMRNEAEPAERRWVVRHLIAGCARCLAVTSSLWALAEPPGPSDPGVKSLDPGVRGAKGAAGAEEAADPADADADDADASAAPTARRRRRRRPRPGRETRRAGTTAVFERFADAIRRIEHEREQAPRLAAELLAGTPPAPPEQLTPPVCEVLLDRSREAGAGEPVLALRAADLALAIAERLDPAVCGPTVVKGLRVRAWAHVAQARRLSDDLDGAEWALALAESLAREMAGLPGAAEAPETPARPSPGVIETTAGTLPFVPAEWAELLVFKAGLFADRGDLRGADRLLGRAAELFHAGFEPQRAGRTLVQQGLIRADLGDRGQAAELLRAGINLLDPVADPGLVAVNLYRLAALLRGIALAAGKREEVRGGLALPARRALEEALRLVRHARTLYRSLGDPAAEAHLTRLQGQLEAELGELGDAEATLAAATAALAEHGCGREAALAQIELAMVLVQQGRAADVHGLGRDHWLLVQARDKSWEWVAAVLVFQVLAASAGREPHHPARPERPEIAKLLGELARYLTPLATHPPLPPHDPRRRRLERVA